MLAYPLRRALVALGLSALVLPLSPASAPAQVREVVSKEVSVGRTEATLRLEFADEGELEITFEDGSILVDGDAIGSFEPGGELEAAWRELLGRAVALDDGPLAEALTDWTVPAELAGELADLAREVDRALEQALTDIDIQIDVNDADPSVSISIGDERSLLRVLIESVGRLDVLEDALSGLEGDFRVYIDEDVVVDADEVVRGTIVSIEGDLSIAGRVDGDVVAVGGTVELLDGSAISGEVRLAGARLLRNQGSVGSGVQDLLEEERDREAELTERIRAEVEQELRARNAAGDRGGWSSLTAPFRSVARAAGGVFENLLVVLVLGLVGAAVLAFGGRKLDVIAETARQSPARAATVGLAGSFLLAPAYILGFVALCVSIIGIPVAIAWLPLFPLLAGLAGVVGYLAVARNTGEWLAESEYPWTGWIRRSNPFITMIGGLLALTLLFMAANVVSVAPFLGFVTGILFFVGCVVTFIAIQIGFGAVLLTRGGRRREYGPGYDPDRAWEEAMSIEVDDPHVDGPDVGPASDGGEGEDDESI